MNFPVLSTSKPEEFIRFWSLRYKDPSESLYEQNIDKPFSEERLLSLFRWKNGMLLSRSKRQTVLTFVARQPEIEEVSTDELSKDKLQRLWRDKGGLIWTIFWLHCSDPAKFPICDMHVLRAMEYIQTGKSSKVIRTEQQKAKLYVENYIPFFNSLPCQEDRSVDKALVTFGRFLVEYSPSSAK